MNVVGYYIYEEKTNNKTKIFLKRYQINCQGIKFKKTKNSLW